MRHASTEFRSNSDWCELSQKLVRIQRFQDPTFKIKRPIRQSQRTTFTWCEYKIFSRKVSNAVYQLKRIARARKEFFVSRERACIKFFHAKPEFLNLLMICRCCCRQNKTAKWFNVQWKSPSLTQCESFSFVSAFPYPPSLFRPLIFRDNVL